MIESVSDPRGITDDPEGQLEDFRVFLTYFPEVTLPVTLTFESRRAFGLDRPPLPELLSARFFYIWEEDVPDDFTEYLPGFRVKLGKHLALVYWKAALMHYSYIMVVVDAHGRLIDRMSLAETLAAEEGIRQGAALIREDGTIVMAESAHTGHDPLGDPRQTISERWRVSAEGRFTEAEEPPNH